MTPIIRIEQLSHTYQPEDAQPVYTLRDLNLSVEQGEYVVILGHNGSGKSTLARQLNALLLPTSGNVWVNELNTQQRQHWATIRNTVGMVFQTPDNQIVATLVEEDIAFGPENLALPHAEIVQRVDWALEQVGLSELRQRAPHQLSGGQKQRLCIAAVLAMRPQVLVLDEATAMLDPQGRDEVLAIIRRLNREQGITIIAITHAMQEALDADRVFVLERGQLVLAGTPRQIFHQAERLRALQLGVPPITELALALREQGVDFPLDVLTNEEMVSTLKQRVEIGDWRVETRDSAPNLQSPVSSLQSPILINNLAHDYLRGTPLQVRAIHDMDLEVRTGEILGIIGHTGSGKSTLVQHFNGLLRAHAGSVTVFGEDLNDPATDLQRIRQQVGLVFQFPESQLFAQYVGDDIAYGPRNLKLSREQVRAQVRAAMAAVGLDFVAYKDRITFTLSGGEKRRVALAGVLALEPAILVLDEPSAGLDPQGRRLLFEQLRALNQQGVTLVLISHNMEELAAFCQRIYVLARGTTLTQGSPAEVFAQADELRSLGLGVPVMTELFEALRAADLIPAGRTVYTIEQAVAALVPFLQQSANGSASPTTNADQN